MKDYEEFKAARPAYAKAMKAVLLIHQIDPEINFFDDDEEREWNEAFTDKLRDELDVLMPLLSTIEKYAVIVRISLCAGSRLNRGL